MEEFNVLSLLSLAYKKLWALILAFVVSAAGAYAYCSFLATPTYSCSTSIVATNGAITAEISSGTSKQSVSATDVAASLQLVDTIVDLLNSSDVYKQTAKEFGTKYAYGEIKSMASIARRGENTMLVDITFTGTDKDDIIKLSNIFAKKSCTYVKKFIPHSNVEVAEMAERVSQVSPRTAMTTAIVGILGAIALFAIFFIIESMNKTLKNEEQFTTKYSLSVLGLIPDFEAAEHEVAKYNGYKKYSKYKKYKSYNYAKSYDTRESKEVKSDGK